MKLMALTFALTSSLMALTAITAQAANATPVICEDVQFYQQQDNGNGQFVKTGLSVAVATQDGRNWQAKLTQGAETRTEVDVNVVVVPPAQASQAKEMASVFLPRLNWSTVASVRIAIIGVKANQQDGGGMSIMELRDKNGAILNKLVQIGWGFGLCTK